MLDPVADGDLAFSRSLARLGGKPGTILVPDRTLTISQPVALLPGQSVVGLGQGSVIHCKGMTAPAFTIPQDGQLRNLSLVGDLFGTAVGFQQGMENLAAYDVIVSNFDVGFLINNSYNIFMGRCWAQSCRLGIHMTGQWVNAVNVIGGRFGDNTTGVLVDSRAALNNLFLGVVFEGNEESGVVIQEAINALKIRDCYFESNGLQHIWVKHPQACGVLIESNYFLGGQAPRKTPVGIQVDSAIDCCIERNAFVVEKPWVIWSNAVRTVVGWNGYDCGFGTVDPAPATNNMSMTTIFK